jgi:hypothetical protein
MNPKTKFQTPPKIAEVKATATTASEAAAPEDPDADWWTPEKEKVFTHISAGYPKSLVAQQVGVHRNTITRWIADAVFQRRMIEQSSDIQESAKQRRVQETIKITDKLARIANRHLDSLDKPVDQATGAQRVANFEEIRATTALLAEYRDFREQERDDNGERYVQKHQHAISGKVEHNVLVTHASFKGFLEETIAKGVIDTTALEGLTPEDMLTALTTQALLRTDILDELTEEDAQIKSQLALENGK